MKSKKILIPLLFTILIMAPFADGPTRAATGNPTVIHTDPASGATGVSRTLDTVVFTFSQPMDTLGVSAEHLRHF